MCEEDVDVKDMMKNEIVFCVKGMMLVKLT